MRTFHEVHMFDRIKVYFIINFVFIYLISRFSCCYSITQKKKLENKLTFLCVNCKRMKKNKRKHSRFIFFIFKKTIIIFFMKKKTPDLNRIEIIFIII